MMSPLMSLAFGYNLMINWWPQGVPVVPVPVAPVLVDPPVPVTPNLPLMYARAAASVANSSTYLQSPLSSGIAVPSVLGVWNSVEPALVLMSTEGSFHCVLG